MSKEFKVGVQVRAITDERAEWGIDKGGVYTVGDVDGATVHIVGQPDGWRHMYERFELVEPVRVYKAGDIVRVVSDDWMRRYAMQHGADPERMVVRSVDERGYPILDWEVETQIAGFDPDIFELVEEAATAPTPYYLVSSPVQKFDTPHATKEAAKEWITEYGTPGVEYKLHRVYDEGTFSVVRELKEAA